MKNKLFTSLLLLVMLVYFSAYGIYTGVRFFYSPYKTETAYMYTVADSFKTTAVAIREERVLSEKVSPEDNINYIKDDGEVVVSGSIVAQMFEDDQQLTYRSQIADYKSEIDLLKRAQHGADQFLAADSVANRVDDAVANIINAVAKKEFDTLKDSRDELQLSLGKYRIGIGRDENYNKRIDYLNSMISSLESKLTKEYRDIRVEEGGYFCSSTDGYESILTTNFDSLSAKDYYEIINKDKEPSVADKAGKIQIGHDWYLAVWAEKADVERFTLGSMVDLVIKVERGIEIPASVHKIIYDDEKNAVVILKTNYVNGPLISMRHADVEIKFKSFTGLKISAAALRYNGLVEGVYVKNNNVINFKEITRIYTDEDYILCKATTDITGTEEEESQYRPLSQFDEVIVEGTDLYDGKFI